ncbi:MAG: polyphenol oxidase family protein [Acidimicrobiia bacterium]
MIEPPARSGVAFSEESDRDLRHDPEARAQAATRLGIDGHWATVTQVHGDAVRHVDTPGNAGEADALWTSVSGLPLAIFTADCFGVVMHATDAVGVAHAGWRGAEAGVVGRLREEMSGAGHPPVRAAIGPGIGPCCFEVGEEVAARFQTSRADTSWGTVSVDLPSVVRAQLSGLDVWSLAACTFHEPGWFSHRRDATPRRLASIGWLQ